jgi:hypothetical protein
MEPIIEVICDTNIWYNIGSGGIDPTIIPSNIKLIATYNSIDEFSRTGNLIWHPNETQKAVQAMFKYSRQHAIYEPPFIYLKKLSDPQFNYNVVEKHSSILNFTSKIAKGHTIDLSKTEEYNQFCQERKEGLEWTAALFNTEAQRIKLQIRDLKVHRRENSVPLNRDLISLFVEKASASTGINPDFNWNQIELFEAVLKLFFNALETGALKAQANDWYDLFILIYVHPGRKFWTKEKKWIRLIVEAGYGNYLFEV